MSIIPGTTPTLILTLDESIAGCAAAELCIVCDNVRILRSLPELAISEDGKEVSCTLTQPETLTLPDNRIAKVQLHTASANTDANIPGLAPDEAERLRDRLSARGEARLAGL